MAGTSSASWFLCGCSCTLSAFLMRRPPPRARRIVSVATSVTCLEKTGSPGPFGLTSTARGEMRRQIQLGLRRYSGRTAVAISPLSAVTPPSTTCVSSSAFLRPSACLSSLSTAAAAVHNAGGGKTSSYSQSSLKQVFCGFSCLKAACCLVHEGAARRRSFLPGNPTGERKELLTQNPATQMNRIAPTRTPLLFPECISHVKQAESRTLATRCSFPAASMISAAFESAAFSAKSKHTKRVNVSLLRQFPADMWSSSCKNPGCIKADYARPISCPRGMPIKDFRMEFAAGSVGTTDGVHAADATDTAGAVIIADGIRTAGVKSTVGAVGAADARDVAGAVGRAGAVGPAEERGVLSDAAMSRQRRSTVLATGGNPFVNRTGTKYLDGRVPIHQDCHGHRGILGFVAASRLCAMRPVGRFSVSAFTSSSLSLGGSIDDRGRRSVAVFLVSEPEGQPHIHSFWQTTFVCSGDEVVLLPRRHHRTFTSVAAAAGAAPELSVATAHQMREHSQQQDLDLLHGVKIPPLGDSVTRGSVLQWRKNIGDHVQLDEVLCVIETDKVTVEIHSDCEGVVVAHAAAEGESLNVGDQLALIRVIDPAAADVAYTTAPPQAISHEPQERQQGHNQQPAKEEKEKQQQQRPSAPENQQHQQHQFTTQQQQGHETPAQQEGQSARQQSCHSTQQQGHIPQRPQQSHSVPDLQYHQRHPQPQPERRTPRDMLNQGHEPSEGATAETELSRESERGSGGGAPQELGESAGTPRGDSEDPQIYKGNDEKREVVHRGNPEQQQIRRRRVPLITFRKRKAVLTDQETGSPHAEEVKVDATGARGVRGDQAQQQRQSPEAVAPNADAAQDEDPLMQLWGVPQWRPLSEEEIEVVNLGGAGVGAQMSGDWNTAMVQSEEKKPQKKQQATKPK